MSLIACLHEKSDTPNFETKQKKKKKEKAWKPPFMEDPDQTHLILGKKRMSLAASLYGGQSLWEKKKQKQENKKRGKK